MKKLFWSHDPVMASVYVSEGSVQHLRTTAAAALERAVAPAAEYLTTLEPFIEFLNVDGECFRTIYTRYFYVFFAVNIRSASCFGRLCFLFCFIFTLVYCSTRSKREYLAIGVLNCKCGYIVP